VLGEDTLQSAETSVLQLERLGNPLVASQSPGGREGTQAISTPIFSGAGLAALPKKMVDRILAKEYIQSPPQHCN